MESYASFDGVKTSYLSKKFVFVNYDASIILLGDSWTRVKEIPNTELVVSLHHNYDESANMSVFDISKKDQIKEIYSLGEVTGGIIIFLPSFFE